MHDFVQRYCDTCGKPKNQLRNGVEFILRCRCDWKRGFLERMRATVNPSCWRPNMKNIMDWNPKIFKNGGGARFRNLLVVQKCFAIARLYEFCFKRIEYDPGSEHRKYALGRSVEQGKNLFIRGPIHSGRGLLMACMKLLAATVDISATPNPGEWAIFKTDLLESESNMFSVSEAARLRVTEQYANVEMLAIENLRSELVGRNGPWKFRAASSIDALLSVRQVRPGCMAFTSGDFIGQLADSYGDKLQEILSSEKTSLLLMFNAMEADSLLKGLQDRYNYLLTASQLMLVGERAKGEGIKERMSEKEILDALYETLVFEDLYPVIPMSGSFDRSAYRKAGSMTMGLSMFPEKYKQQAVDVYKRFKEEKEANLLSYRERRNRACMSAVELCPELSKKMTQKELLETGLMMSHACVDKNQLQVMIDKTREIRSKFND